MKVVLLIFLSTILLFYHLDSPMLWQDEGEVALVARNITEFGLPLAYDGQTLITQEEGQDSQLVGQSRLWSWNTWLPYYAAAASFKIFGESTTAARLPFSLAAVGTVVIYYLLAKKIKAKAVICLLVLATNALFYLYSRQARYYAFSMLFPLLAVYFYFSKRYFLYFLSLLASFHSNFVLAMGLNLPLILISLKNRWTLLFLSQAAAWLYFFHPPGRNWDGVWGITRKIIDYFNLINSFYFPLVLAPLLVFWRKFGPVLKLLIVGTIVHVVVISIALRFGQRYLVTLIPIFSLFIGLVLSWLWQKNALAFLLLLPFFLFTNAPFVISERVVHPAFLKSPLQIRSFFLDYIYSLPRDYPGPLEGISAFLVKEKPDKSALIYTDYEINSLRFYFPGLRFVDHPSTEVTYWLPRHNWGFLRELTACQKNYLESRAQKVVLPYFDTQWENLPDITYHQFQIDSQTPPVTIYKLPAKISWPKCS